MSQSILSILILAGIAIFLILRLRSVLGTREGFENPAEPISGKAPEIEPARRGFEVIEGGPDHDIVDNVEAGTRAADSLAAIKRIEQDFTVTEFIAGARGAYEMILMAFEHDNLEDIQDFLSEDVFEAFADVVQTRQDAGLKVESNFIGLREVQIIDADFDASDSEAEIKLRFVADITSVVKNDAGDVVEGSPDAVKKQKDIWTFARTIGADDPNWQLVATGA